MLVEEAQGVHDLVGQAPPAAGVAQVDVVPAHLHAQWGGADHALVDKVDVVCLTLVWHHPDAGLGLVLEHNSGYLVPVHGMKNCHFLHLETTKILSGLKHL